MQLGFSPSPLTKPLVLSATIKTRWVDRDHCSRYGFQVVSDNELERQLLTEYFRLFNRRGMYRVKSALDTAVEVTLTSGGGRTVPARMVDISGSGVTACIAVEEDRTFVLSDSVKVSIYLSKCKRPLQLESIIRLRHDAGSIEAEVQYGIEFDFKLSEDPQRQQDIIIDFMATLRERDGGVPMSIGGLESVAIILDSADSQPD